MKKIVVFLFSLLWLIPMAQAVPALRGKFQYKQPDGTVIILELHGDEYYHWTTDASGRTVEKGSDGFYQPVDETTATQKARAARARAQARKVRWSSFDNPFPTNFGDRKILCLLAEFQPEYENGEMVFPGTFVVDDPNQHFTSMLNQPGYSDNGAFGSVRDYYLANSLNQYRPQFDVYGPVTLSHSSSYYDDDKVHEAIIEAYNQLSGQINIADYDTDDNGMVDMILFYYPGYNEAEHGPSWTIWPHQGTTSGSYGNLGGKRFNRYFCTSELRGASGSVPAAIGTTCHEFAHSLGLPDFYDVGKTENGGENAIVDLTYEYDLMCYGNYNDEGRRPPYLTSLERNMLGWMEMPSPITSSGNHTLTGIQNNVALRIDGRVEGEFFLLECRNKTDWDSGIPEGGMVVFHVDQSAREIASGVTATSLWGTNNINSFGGHPCYRIIHSRPFEYTDDFVLPGQGVTSFAPVDWDGITVGKTLEGISYNQGEVSFTVSVDDTRTIDGFVKDMDGNPLQGVTVVLSQSMYEFAAPPLLSTDEYTITDVNGYYCFELAPSASQDQIVTARKDGYVSVSCNITMTGNSTRQNFTLLRPGLAPPATLCKFNRDTNTWGVVNFGVSSLAVGMRYTAGELSELGAVGATVSTVSFLLGADQGETVNVVVDLGGSRTVINVTQGYTAKTFNTVDLSSLNLVIPADKDVYIGIGLDNIATTYPFYASPASENNGGCYLLQNFHTNGGSWMDYYGYYPYNFAVSAVLARDVVIDFASYDVSYAKLVNGVPQVVPAAGKTVHAVTWYVDGTAVGSTPPAIETLSAGAHTYMARLEYYDGTAERVYYDVTKE